MVDSVYQRKDTTMSMQDVTVATTETGTTYEFVENFCLRNQEHIMKIWTMMSGVEPYSPGELGRRLTGREPARVSPR